jgi:ABC-type multidrug transport system ATPase subunit
MATHQLDRAAQLADRVSILTNGKIGYDARADALETSSLATTYAKVTGMVSAR